MKHFSCVECWSSSNNFKLLSMQFCYVHWLVIFEACGRMHACMFMREFFYATSIILKQNFTRCIFISTDKRTRSLFAYIIHKMVLWSTWTIWFSKHAYYCVNEFNISNHPHLIISKTLKVSTVISWLCTEYGILWLVFGLCLFGFLTPHLTTHHVLRVFV